MLVGPLARHAAHDGQRFVWRAATMLATARLCNACLRMLTTLPMNRQHDLACFIINVGNDLLHESAKQLLACAHGDAGCVPGGCEILGKCLQGQGWVQPTAFSRSRPGAARTSARAEARTPSSSQAVRRSSDCRGHMLRSGAPPARPHSVPAAVRVPRYDVGQPELPCASVPLAVQLRRPLARRRATAPRATASSGRRPPKLKHRDFAYCIFGRSHRYTGLPTTPCVCH
jgi:hypothetical protein